MSNQINKSTLIADLSTEEQQLLTGGRKYNCGRPKMIGGGDPDVGNNDIGTKAIPSTVPARTIITIGGPGVGNNNIGISQY